MKALLLAGLLSVATDASAAAHSLAVRITSGKAVFTQTLKVSEGEQANFVGPATAANGAQRRMIVNVVVGPGSAKSGVFDLQYQVELSGERGSADPSLQAQGSLSLRPGVAVTAVDCGSWTVALSLDGGKVPGAGKAAAFDDAGLGNRRVTADLSRGSARKLCRHVTSPGSQGNLVEGFSRGGRKYGFILNSLLAEQGTGGFTLQYQLEQTPIGLSTLQLQNQETLALGRPSVTDGKGYRLSLLVEGAAPKAAAPAAAAPAPAASGEAKAVPLLR